MKVLTKVHAILISDLILKLHTLSDTQEIGKQFLETIGEIIPYRAATFYKNTDFENQTDSSPVTINISCQDLDNYQTHYVTDYTKWMFSLSKSMVCRESDLWSEKERISTSYYQTMYAPKQIHYATIISLVYNSQFLGCCSLYRNKTDGDFSNDEIFLLDLIKEHLALALARCSSDTSGSAVDPHLFSDSLSLTGREREVLMLIVKGESHEEICTKLAISIHTLKSHLQNIYQKAGVKGKLQLFHKMGILK